MKVVFIAYFFKPFLGVGAQRLTYWADNANSKGVEAEVITSINQEDQSNYPIHVVENTRRKRTLSAIIKDEGYSWYLDLKDFFDKNKIEGVNSFVISGGPFMHFEIAKDLNKLYPESKVILDYRDPFGNNPRFNEGTVKRLIKQFFEKKFNSNADKIITVNSFCAELIQSNKTVVLIDNGYDEKAISKVDLTLAEKPGQLILAGKFYPNNDHKPLENVLKNNSVTLIHFGAKSNKLNYSEDQGIIYGGFVSYNEVLLKIQTSEIGVVFTNGEPFESTTKVFDYMALNKKILLVTEGKKNTGRLEQITSAYPNIIWAENNTEDIQNGLNALLALKTKHFDSFEFSRDESLNKLIQAIK